MAFYAPRRRNSIVVFALFCGACLLLLLQSADAFAPMSPSILHHQQQQQQRASSCTTTTSKSMSLDSSSELTAALTLDPTTALSDLLGGLLGSPAILLVPIVAAFGVAGLIAFGIVSYANPEVEDDE